MAFRLKTVGRARQSHTRRRPGKRTIVGLIGSTVLAATVTGCSGGADNTLARARRDGFIRIGYAVEAPYAYLTPQGQVSGESPSLARKIAARLGIPRVEWRLTDFDSLIDGLNAGRFDVIAAGMFVTPERARAVAFSRPTFRVHPALMVRRGNPRNLHSYADLVKDPSVRIAVLSGSVEQLLLQRLGVPGSRLVEAPDALSARALVDSGKVDALTLSAPTIRWMVDTDTSHQLEMAAPFDTSAWTNAAAPRYGAFAFRKDDRALRRAWDAALRKYMGSADQRALARRFGFTSADLPPAAAPPPAD